MSPELVIEEHSFIPDYFGVSPDFHTLGLGFIGLAKAKPDETVD